jgi:23S rRNA (uracil-5-)-methyltransferase RumA
LVTAREPTEQLVALAEAVAAAVPEVVSVVSLLDTGGTSRAARNDDDDDDDETVDGPCRVLWGDERLRMHMGGYQFDVSARSFFQTNTRQGSTLVRIMEEACGLKADGSEVLLDLYCGVGLLGISLARHCREVWGVELVEAAVEDATRNAELNGVTNATFVQGDLGAVAASLGTRIPPPDVVVVDPNRAGCPPALTAFLRQAAAATVVYVSCNPATQARDVRALCAPLEEGQLGTAQGARYTLVSVTPVDMFPHTAHVETVAVLRRSDK